MIKANFNILSEAALREACGLCKDDWLLRATVGVFIIDAERVIYANPHLAGLFGHTQAEICGRMHPCDLIGEDFRAAAMAAIDACLRGQDAAAPQFFDGLRADGRRIHVEALGTRTDYLGAPAIIGLLIDHTDRRRAEQQLFGSHEKLRSLTARIESVREDERTRISREIHDELGQTLTGLKMDMSWLHGQLRDDQQALADKLEQMSALIDVTVQTVRKISWELRPGPLDSLGLVAAIEWQAREFQVRNGIRCKLKLPDECPDIDETVASSLFRILQELLTNVTRHAAASAVDVRLQLDDGGIVLTVRDNGRGMSGAAEAGQHSLGLLGVRERARHLGGEVEIVSAPRIKGTKVTVAIPLPQGDAQLR
jgi:PAS domain S-box-containing protein